MARIKKPSTICAVPRFRRFSPLDSPSRSTVRLTYDEFEVLRLHDLEHFTQEEAAKQMQVSRPTVTEMLTVAHGKIADALVNGKPLFIEGGDIDFCQREHAGCGKKCGHICYKKSVL